MNKSIKKYFPLFALPTLVAFTIGFIIPFAMGIYLSFCKFTTVTDAKFVGLSNYTKIFGDETFVHSLWYTALFTIVSVLAINFFAFVIAMLLTKGIRGTNAFRTIFFMPNLIGGIYQDHRSHFPASHLPVGFSIYHCSAVCTSESAQT